MFRPGLVIRPRLHCCHINPPLLSPPRPSLLLTDRQMSPYQSLDSPVSETEFPLLRWEDIQHYLPLSPQSQPSLSDNELAASKISAVLSARTYPYPPPGRSTSRGPRDDLADVPLCCGILLDSSSQEDGHGELSASRDECVEPDQPTRMPSKRQRSDATVAAPSSRKRGRPRKATDRREGIDNNEVCFICVPPPFYSRD